MFHLQSPDTTEKGEEEERFRIATTYDGSSSYGSAYYVGYQHRCVCVIRNYLSKIQLGRKLNFCIQLETIY